MVLFILASPEPTKGQADCSLHQQVLARGKAEDSDYGDPATGQPIWFLSQAQRAQASVGLGRAVILELSLPPK
jgi:hypothetical protein